MELLTCGTCQSPNCYIQHTGWFVCRDCGQATRFDGGQVAGGIKLALFHLVKDAAELGTPDQQVADLINREKVASCFWLEDETGLKPLPDGHEYAKYYNLFVRFKYGTSGIPKAGEAADTPSPGRRKKKAADRNANGGR